MLRPSASWSLKKIISAAFITVCLVAGFMLESCTNPFAPKLATSQENPVGLGDQRTIEGVFQNFRYAYTFKDTLIYGRLLTPDYTFIFRDYDQGIDITRTRDEDMRRTAGLFQAAQSLELVWNEIFISTGDSLTQDISRGFNLTITFSRDDVVQLSGRVNLRLRKNQETGFWQILRWRDETNY